MQPCATTCPYCGVGCGVTANSETDPDGEKVVTIMGDGNHPANAGRLCVKGTALAETLSTEGRLLHPRLHGERITWDSALDELATRLRITRERYGPQSIGFYLSGQLLTEDYYAANKLMKGFLGSANVDTNSRLCMSSAVAAYQRAFGEDVVPCSYDDLDDCDLLVMAGSNAAWTHPVIYQRIATARANNPDKRVVVIDTRRTATCDIADIFLQIHPGSDRSLFGGLLRYLAQQAALDHAFIEAHTSGFEQALEHVQPLDSATVCVHTGLDEATLLGFYRLFARRSKTVTLYSQGINQSIAGTDNCNAIINCHLATGRIGKPGTGPFSITGQPNAMGGREVGGLASQLAVHRGFTARDVEEVGRFWDAADMAQAPGLKAVELFQSAARGELKFLWIMATNPVVSLPDSASVCEALKRCDFVAVSDCSAETDTTALADLLLPAAAWGEKSGTVTNSERVISRQRQFSGAAGEAKPDWWIVSQVARRLGFGRQFDYNSPADIFREHAALSGFENNGERCFDISGLAEISDKDYDALLPQRWPVAQHDAAEPFADGRFSTADRRARFVPVTAAATPYPTSDARPLVVNSGRLRDQWHTMTRTGLVPRLARHRDFFSISINPRDAIEYELQAGELARLENDRGAIAGIVALDDDLPTGQVWVPIHWSEQFAARARANALYAPVTDPVSGQPGSKFELAKISPLPVACWGLVFSREPLRLEGVDYWSHIRVEEGYVTLIADSRSTQTLSDRLAPKATPGQRACYADPALGEVRQLVTHAGNLQLAMFLSRERDALPERQWIGALAAAPAPEATHQLLAGCDPATQDAGALVCSCWEVGEKQIFREIAGGATSIESLGERLRCGTQCGSCIPELKAMLRLAEDDCAA